MNENGDRVYSEGENSQEYAKFILELLQAELDSNSGIQVIYPILKQRQHLLNARFAETLQQVAQTLISQNPEAIEFIVALIGNLSIHIYQFPLASRANNIEIAITGYQIVLNNRQPGSEKLAQTQNNLAVAYSDRINGSRAENLERAIEFYQAALTVYTLEAFPEYWATTQNNLAAAYSDRIKGSRAENLERALEFYQAALTVCTLEDFPEKWAGTQNNIAVAYSKRINGSRAENLERAIEFYEAALTVCTLENFPIDNVETLNNLGWAYLAKLDYINQEKPEDTNQKAATLQSAYNTFKNAIAGAAKLRKLESQNETKQKHDLQWDRLYMGMVQVCLDRKSNQEALEYAEANKARNLAEIIAQKQEIPQTLAPITFSEITQLLAPNTALIEWYITDAEIITFVVTYPDVLTVHRHRQWDELTDLVNEYREAYKQSKTDWQKQLATYLQRLADILQITTILPPSSTRLIVIFHWLLHLFPLHALPLSDGEFLLDRFLEGIQYAPSCQLLQQITIHPNFDQLLALQNPTSDLNYTDLEVTSIAPKFAIGQILSGDEASKTNLLEKYLDRLENAHCAHFSCHGSFNPDDPLKSFLILSGGIVGEEPPQPPLLSGEQDVVKVPLVSNEEPPQPPLLRGEQDVVKVPLVSNEEPPQPPLLRGEQDVVKVPLVSQEEPPQPPLLRGEQDVVKVPLVSNEEPPQPPLLRGEQDVVKVPLVSKEEPPQPPLLRGEQDVVKVPLTKGDLGGKNLSEQAESDAIKVPLTKGDLGGSERYVEWREGKTADINNCLTLADILLLQFKHCRLVVLSACETALIDTNNRSDYIGLPTGFIHAGAMGTLASLWAVNDLSTALIMVKFYELLQPEVSIGKALHDTQRWFKSAKTPDLLTWVKESDSFDADRKEYTQELLGRYNDDEKPYGDVYHWGAFCAIGL